MNEYYEEEEEQAALSLSQTNSRSRRGASMARDISLNGSENMGKYSPIRSRTEKKEELRKSSQKEREEYEAASEKGGLHENTRGKLDISDSSLFKTQNSPFKEERSTDMPLQRNFEGRFRHEKNLLLDPDCSDDPMVLRENTGAFSNFEEEGNTMIYTSNSNTENPKRRPFREIQTSTSSSNEFLQSPNGSIKSQTMRFDPVSEKIEEELEEEEENSVNSLNGEEKMAEDFMRNPQKMIDFYTNKLSQAYQEILQINKHWEEQIQEAEATHVKDLMAIKRSNEEKLEELVEQYERKLKETSEEFEMKLLEKDRVIAENEGRLVELQSSLNNQNQIQLPNSSRTGSFPSYLSGHNPEAPSPQKFQNENDHSASFNEKSLKENLINSILPKIEEDLRKELEEEIRSELYEELKMSAEEELRREIEENVRREIEEEIRKAFEEEYEEKLQERMKVLQGDLKKEMEIFVDTVKQETEEMMAQKETKEEAYGRIFGEEKPERKEEETRRTWEVNEGRKTPTIYQKKQLSSKGDSMKHLALIEELKEENEKLKKEIQERKSETGRMKSLENIRLKKQEEKIKGILEEKASAERTIGELRSQLNEQNNGNFLKKRRSLSRPSALPRPEQGEILQGGSHSRAPSSVNSRQGSSKKETNRTPQRSSERIILKEESEWENEKNKKTENKLTRRKVQEDNSEYPCTPRQEERMNVNVQEKRQEVMSIRGQSDEKRNKIITRISAEKNNGSSELGPYQSSQLGETAYLNERVAFGAEYSEPVEPKEGFYRVLSQRGPGECKFLDTVEYSKAMFEQNIDPLPPPNGFPLDIKGMKERNWPKDRQCDFQENPNSSTRERGNGISSGNGSGSGITSKPRGLLTKKDSSKEAEQFLMSSNSQNGFMSNDGLNDVMGLVEMINREKKQIGMNQNGYNNFQKLPNQMEAESQENRPRQFRADERATRMQEERNITGDGRMTNQKADQRNHQFGNGGPIEEAESEISVSNDKPVLNQSSEFKAAYEKMLQIQMKRPSSSSNKERAVVTARDSAQDNGNKGKHYSVLITERETEKMIHLTSDKGESQRDQASSKIGFRGGQAKSRKTREPRESSAWMEAFESRENDDEKTKKMKEKQFSIMIQLSRDEELKPKISARQNYIKNIFIADFLCTEGLKEDQRLLMKLKSQLERLYMGWDEVELAFERRKEILDEIEASPSLSSLEELLSEEFQATAELEKLGKEMFIMLRGRMKIKEKIQSVAERHLDIGELNRAMKIPFGQLRSLNSEIVKAYEKIVKKVRQEPLFRGTKIKEVLSL